MHCVQRRVGQQRDDRYSISNNSKNVTPLIKNKENNENEGK